MERFYIGPNVLHSFAQRRASRLKAHTSPQREEALQRPMKNDKRKKLEARISELEAKPQLTPEEESEVEEKREQLEELEEQEAEVRVALRLPSNLHDEVRRMAKREKLNLNDALIRLIEQGSDQGAGGSTTDEYQQFRDMMELCKLLGVEEKPELKRALAKRAEELYNLPIDVEDADSGDAEQRAQWEAYSKKKEPFKMYRRDGDPLPFADFAAFKRASPAQRKQALQWRAVTDRDIEEAKKRLRHEGSRGVAANR